MIATRLRWSRLAPALLLVSCSGAPVATSAAAPADSGTPPVASATEAPSPSLTERCEDGDLSACVARATELETATTPDPDQARTLFDRACAKKVAAGCAGAARLSYVADSLPEALRLYETACALDDGRACADAGAMHQAALGTARDFTRAASLYERACSLGSGLGCAGQASLLLTGETGRLDRAAAAALFAKACRLKYQLGCESACRLKHPSCRKD